ncbi:MAG: hypothetical protein KDK10_13340 [Maritimibacter sp.]|nr:hypothetical protein [Maritimibacter sp.]
MNGAILYDTKYGATEQYARWIGEASGLPVFSLAAPEADPERYDFVVLGSPVISQRVLVRAWVALHLAGLLARPVILFTVSGTGVGARLDGWVRDSLPAAFLDHARHFALRGRLEPRKLGLYDRLKLQIGGGADPDGVAARGEIAGFDFMDRAAIGPVVAAARRFARAAAA